jgi:hypothetical protein
VICTDVLNILAEDVLPLFDLGFSHRAKMCFPAAGCELASGGAFHFLFLSGVVTFPFPFSVAYSCAVLQQ